jgi:hypothetical protein
LGAIVADLNMLSLLHPCCCDLLTIAGAGRAYARWRWQGYWPAGHQ